MNLPNQIEYAHQVKPDSELHCFEFRKVPIHWRVFPADDIDPLTTYQVLSVGGTPLSDAEPFPTQSLAQAAYWLMDNSRTEYKKSRLISAHATKEQTL